jgi:hypothetical protein
MVTLFRLKRVIYWQSNRLEGKELLVPMYINSKASIQGEDGLKGPKGPIFVLAHSKMQSWKGHFYMEADCICPRTRVALFRVKPAVVITCRSWCRGRRGRRRRGRSWGRSW